MESFMDEVIVESIVHLGTKVTMKKSIKKEQTIQKKQEEIVEQNSEKEGEFYDI